MQFSLVLGGCLVVGFVQYLVVDVYDFVVFFGDGNEFGWVVIVDVGLMLVQQCFDGWWFVLVGMQQWLIGQVEFFVFDCIVQCVFKFQFVLDLGQGILVVVLVGVVFGFFGCVYGGVGSVQQ